MAPFLCYNWVMNEHSKVCTTCNAALPIDSFDERPDRPGKFNAKCRPCMKEFRRDAAKRSYQNCRDRRIEGAKRYREDNAEKVRQSVREYNSRPEVIARKREYMKTYRRPWREYVGDECERCGFTPEDKRQLDVHHKDGSKKNNDPSNLETLCANCHRIIDHSTL